MYQMFDGIKFNLDRKNGYLHGRKNGKHYLMHRYVLEYYNGEIPENFHIHHKDGNKENNDISNLECINGHEHSSYHSNKRDKNILRENIKKAQEYAIIWHKSEEGRNWHSIHAKEVAEKLRNEKVTCICEFCGKEYKTVKNMLHKSKFCSNNCKSAYRRKIKADFIEKQCEICGNVFESNKYNHVRTCSRKCANELIKLNMINK